MTELDWLDAFSENLREIMDEKGYSQRDLADATGLSESSISYYMAGQRIPGTGKQEEEIANKRML